LEGHPHSLHTLDTSHILSLILLLAILLGLAALQHHLAKQSVKELKMPGDFWTIIQMEENTACFASM
jgi:hypothetical protein